ncbi:helix-turn-helix domain-containing protein [Streptomyces decoyicus]
MLHRARGRSNVRVARETGLNLGTVRTWRGRFAEQGLPGLADRKRPGRPPVFTALQTAQVKALACRMSAGCGYGRASRLGLQGTFPCSRQTFSVEAKSLSFDIVPASDIEDSLNGGGKGAFEGLKVRDSLLYIDSRGYFLPRVAVIVFQPQDDLDDFCPLVEGQTDGPLHAHAELSSD